jgi:uncharacterized protein (UPF0128 family)
MKTKKILFYLLAALLGGCVPVMSLHPLFGEKDVVFNEKLIGTWVEEPNEGNTIWEFKRADINENAYQLIFSDKEGKKGLFTTHLVRLKDKLFLDICPAEQQDSNKIEWAFNTLLLIPAHTFIKVNSIEPQLKMQITDDEKMKEFLKADPNAIKHEFLDEQSLILTASTKELQAFVLKHADDSRVFIEAMVLSRKKIAEPNATPPSKPDKTSK